MKTFKTDYLIVGSGLFGSVLAERIATQRQKKVLVLEKRPHIGGNCYSQFDESTGIEYHKYGTHIFHTNSKKILNYINQFTELNSYHHQVLTSYKNQIFQLPINLETINSFFKTNLRPYEVDSFLEKERQNFPEPKNLEEKAMSLVGKKLYEAFIKGYTWKQWQTDPKDLPASIINRLPVRSNYDENYFKNGKYQGIPQDGYTSMFNKMLSSSLIDIKTNTDYFEIKDQIEVKNKTIYSGPIDRYFNFIHGKLQWRSVYFKKEIKEYDDYLGTSVMNFADKEIPYTRIHEPKHLHPEREYTKKKTLLLYEYSHQDEEAPYYPINNEENIKKLEKYKSLAKKEKNVLFGGRLGSYAYYDMDQVIGQALALSETRLS